MEAMSTNDNCHYIHKEGETVAALDMCDSSNVRGIVIKNKRSRVAMKIFKRFFWVGLVKDSFIKGKG